MSFQLKQTKTWSVSLLIGYLGLGCSLVTLDDAAQCETDSDCVGLGLDPICQADENVCVEESSGMPLAPASTSTPSEPSVVSSVPSDADTSPSEPDPSEPDPSDSTLSEPECEADAGDCSPPPLLPTCSEGVDCPVPPLEPEAVAAWSLEELRPALGDSTGGDHFALYCAPDEVLIGVRPGVGAWLDQMSGVCARMEPTDAAPNFVTLERTQELSPYPAESGSETLELTCPPGLAVVGARISQQNYTGEAAHVVVPEIWVTCGEVYRDGPEAEPVLTRGATEIGPLSGSYADFSAWFASDQIPSGQLVVGLHGTAGSWLDRLGLVTGNASVALE